MNKTFMLNQKLGLEWNLNERQLQKFNIDSESTQLWTLLVNYRVVLNAYSPVQVEQVKVNPTRQYGPVGGFVGIFFWIWGFDSLLYNEAKCNLTNSFSCSFLEKRYLFLCVWIGLWRAWGRCGMSNVLNSFFTLW